MPTHALMYFILLSELPDEISRSLFTWWQKYTAYMKKKKRLGKKGGERSSATLAARRKQRMAPLPSLSTA